MNRLFLTFGIILSIYSSSLAQIDSVAEAVNKGIKIEFAKNTKSFAKFGIYTQLWARYSQFNSPQLDYDENSINNDFDFIMRRTGFTSLIVIDKFKFFTNLTVSSQSNTSAVTPYANRSPQLYFYDIWASYGVLKNYLTIGGGLHMYNGISRHSSASSVGSLGADVPLIAAPNLLTTDQSARQLGMFFTGNINSFAYRIAINKPFVTSTLPADTITQIVFHKPTNNFCYTGYFEYQILDKESNFMPFKNGTYLGEKRILNIGVGFYNHANATLSFNADSTKNYHNITHFAADVFFEHPLNNNRAITFYGAYYLFNYGPNYTHSFGLQESFKGSLAEYQFGTGEAYFMQAAYLFPSFKKSQKIQPFYELTIRNFEGLDSKKYHHNVGINYFVIGHHIKLTLQYENRPYDDIDFSTQRRSMLIGKFQLAI
ncbi:MAG: hypothetical protein JEZ09_16400 [Salinivirgaceae bacterium]|nr:hypothetical protein [Salinivirgaceae bacterium]